MADTYTIVPKKKEEEKPEYEIVPKAPEPQRLDQPVGGGAFEIVEVGRTRIKDLSPEDQYMRMFELANREILKHFQAGEVTGINEDWLDVFLDSEHMQNWYDNFGDKTMETISQTAGMVWEDLVVNGFSPSAQRERVTESLEQSAFDRHMERIKGARLKIHDLIQHGATLEEKAQIRERYPAPPDLSRGYPSPPQRGVPRRGALAEELTSIKRATFQYQMSPEGETENQIRQVLAKAWEARAALGARLNREINNPNMPWDKINRHRRKAIFKKIKERTESSLESLEKNAINDIRELIPEKHRKAFDAKKFTKIDQIFEIVPIKDRSFLSTTFEAMLAESGWSRPMTPVEGVVRGTADIGLIGNMIVGAAFDNTHHHQVKYNAHMHKKLAAYWKANGREYSRESAQIRPDFRDVPRAEIEKWQNEIPKVWDDLKKARRDKFYALHTMMVDRERARNKQEMLGAQWLRGMKWLPGQNQLAEIYERNVNSSGAEAGSYFLDPLSIVTFGATSVARNAATKPLIRSAVGGAADKTGGKLIEWGARGRQMVDDLNQAGGVPTELATPKAGLAARATEKAGHALEATGQAMSKEGAFFDNLAHGTAGTEGMRRGAYWASRLGGDRALSFAGDMATATGTGVGVGFGLGFLSDDLQTGIGGATTGGMLGAIMVVPARLATSETRMRQQQSINRFLEGLDEESRTNMFGKSFDELEQMATLNSLAKGLTSVEGAGDVRVTFRHDAGRKTEGAWLSDENEVTVNTAYGGKRSLAHEVSHALDAIIAGAPDSRAAARWQNLNNILFDRTAGDVTIKGLYSLNDEFEFFKQYHGQLKKSLSPEALEKWEQEHGMHVGTSEITIDAYQGNNVLRQSIQSEVRAESFANMVDASGAGMLDRSKNIRQVLVDHVLMGDHSAKLAKFRWALESMGVEFKPDGGVSELFFKDGKGITNSAEVNAFLRDFVRARDGMLKRVAPEGGEMPAQQSFTMKEVANEPALVQYFGASDAFARDRNGEIIMVNNKPVILPVREVNKLQRQRVEQIMKALDTVDSAGGLQRGETAAGKPRWSGKSLNDEQLKAILDLPDDVMSPRLKENLQFIHDQIKAGNSIHFDYNAALRGKNYSSAIQAAWRHDMPYSMEIAQAGNFNIKTLNVDRIQAKVNRWRRDKKGRYLDLWDGNYHEFYGALMQYMDNHSKGLPGHTNLHVDEGTALKMKGRLNELFDVPGSADVRPESIGGFRLRGRSTLSSRRLDRTNQMRTGGGEWSANYGMLRQNLKPATKPKAGEGAGPEVRYLPAGKNAEVAPGVVKATPNKPFQLDENVRAQFLPATKKVNLEDYADRNVIALAADRMGIGEVFVGPEGGKRPLSIDAQGGRGFMNIFNGGGWAFSDAGTARKFLTRLKKDADADGNAVVGITIQSPVNHLKNQAGQLAYVEAMQAAVESGAISKRAADSQVRAMSDAILASGSKKMTATTRAKIKRIRNLAGLEKAVRAKSLNFEDMNWVLKQWERKQLHIPDSELRAMDIAPDNIARGITDPELRDLPNYSVVALMEVNVNQVPDVTQFHYAYPVTVHGNAIGYLNRFHNIKDLTTDQRIIQKGTGQVGAQPLQTVMPVMDNILKATREMEGIPSDPSARYLPAEKLPLKKKQKEIERLTKFSSADNTNTNRQVELGVVSQAIGAKIKDGTNLDVEGYAHVLDRYAVEHIRKRHGDDEAESKHGFVGVSDQDLKRIPDIIRNFDQVRLVGKNDRGLDVIEYTKMYPSGEVFFFEEVRVGRHTLAASSMRKKKPPRARNAN